jgi:gamma-glutamylcyclotransferase (GGCT)/AIG2-like uncharacterized protein YtfP
VSYNPRVRKAGYSSAIHDVVDRLFVYGTLRAGQPARSMIEDHVARSEPATTEGALIAFPDYPGVLDRAAGTIQGELVWLTGLAAAFALLDAYEGDDFIRVLKKCRKADGEEEYAWVYVLADPRLEAAGTAIPHGDWVRWLGERG